MTPFRPNTSDGRYFGVRSRLWRRANPGVPDAKRKALVSRLMARVVQSARQASDATALATALDAVNPTKIALCDRGPFWRTDASPDLNPHMARTTPCADGLARLEHGCGA